MTRLAGVLAFALAAASLSPAMAQRPGSAPGAAAPAAAAEPIRRLPADSVTKHVLDLPGRSLHFTATTGAVTLNNAEGAAQAQIGFIAYQLEDADPHARPVTFAMNGGPGSASAWLQLGLLGPWRLPMDPASAAPSASPVPQPNAETWLDFTDLVFIDPVGTGFSKLLVNSEENRKKYWSVTGDVASVADAIRSWLQMGHRMSSPKYILGESYSGLRGPRLVRALTGEQNVGISGLVLISPKLDYGGRSHALDPLSWVAVLPSEVASIRARTKPVTRADLADVEAYAAGDYASDLIRGEEPAALARRIDRITALTGLDRALVVQRHGRVQNFEFLREANRATDSVASPYDATVTKADPFPGAASSFHPDPMTDSLQPVFASAILDLYAGPLHWLPEAQYQMSNSAVFRAWDFGNDFTKPESVTSLRVALATDPHFRVLIAHGLFDLLTPYFDTKMMLDQIPPSVGTDRIDFEVYPGGHMFYSQDASRAAFRDAARRLYGAP